MQYIVGRLVCNFFAASCVAPQGTTYSVIEEVDPISRAGTGKFFLADGREVISVKIGTGESACGFCRVPANFELLLPYRVTEPPRDRSA